MSQDGNCVIVSSMLELARGAPRETFEVPIEEELSTNVRLIKFSTDACVEYNKS